MEEDNWHELDSHAIGLDDLARIQRDQFVHYLTLARVVHDPTDWPTFRLALLDALNAAFGLGFDPAEPDRPDSRDILELLDATRLVVDPVGRWPRFMDDIWHQRHWIREDLE